MTARAIAALALVRGATTRAGVRVSAVREEVAEAASMDELARLPPAHWAARMAEQSRQLTLPLQIGALANQPLAASR